MDRIDLLEAGLKDAADLPRELRHELVAKIARLVDKGSEDVLLDFWDDLFRAAHESLTK